MMVENFINYSPFLRLIRSECFWQVLAGIGIVITAIAFPISPVELLNGCGNGG
ncbi:MAG: hypothetical protein ACRCZS_03010 [Chroococcidiopsis sp.]